jgi:hypothetical protein
LIRLKRKCFAKKIYYHKISPKQYLILFIFIRSFSAPT